HFAIFMLTLQYLDFADFFGCLGHSFSRYRARDKFGFAKGKTEGATVAFRTFKYNGATLGCDNFFSHEQAEAGAIRSHLAGIPGPIKFRKQMVLFALWNAYAIIY